MQNISGQSSTIEVLFIEDQPVVFEAAQAAISLLPRVRGTFACNSAESALSALRAEPKRWSLIFLDLDVPGAIGLSLAMEIRELGKADITCILTGSNTPEYISRIEAHGFQGYILKTTETHVMNLALQKAVAGEKVFPEQIQAANIAVLTARQTACLRLASEGMTDKMIARTLGLSPSTVIGHMTAAMDALGVQSRTHAVRHALQMGLIK